MDRVERLFATRCKRPLAARDIELREHAYSRQTKPHRNDSSRQNHVDDSAGRRIDADGMAEPRMRDYYGMSGNGDCRPRPGE